MSEPAEPECWCEYVDIGVGWQRVAENPECPRHTEGLPPPPGGIPLDEMPEQQHQS